MDFNKIKDLFLFDPNSPMIFTSGFFLFWFLAVLSIYLLIYKKERARILFLTIVSTYFYYKSSGVYFLILVVSIVVDYHLAKWIDHSKNEKERKGFLIVSLLANLGMLAYFKYTNYFGELWAAASGGHFEPFDIFLPVGISFFTFQSLSYTIDVYRKELKSLESIWDYAFFVTFFPQMVAGPIVRAVDFIPQIKRVPFVSRDDFGRGIYLILVGLFKKAVIADYISINFVDRIFDSPEKYTGIECLFGSYAYALQIYCDFSGYSDIAIGIGLLMGFHFPINFDSPYQSASVTEFWRRWHISLSTWLRDYLYIPLGGNRKGRLLTYRNLFLTMLLGGLWHGAANRFLIWGALHGLALGAEKWWKETFSTKIPRFLGILLTFHFVCFCWLFFRAADLATVGKILTQIGTTFQPQFFGELVAGYPIVFSLLFVGFLAHSFSKKTEVWAEKLVAQMPLVLKAAALVAMIFLVMQFKSSDVQPFIYFQF